MLDLIPKLGFFSPPLAADPEFTVEPRAYLFACGFKEHISDRQTSLGSRGVFMAKYRSRNVVRS